PKWFVKDPRISFRQEVDDMLRVVRQAGSTAARVGPQESPFDLWWAMYRQLGEGGVAQGFPPLLSGPVASLVDGALIDATCRALEVPCAAALRSGALGLSLQALHPELAGGLSPVDVLPPAAGHSVALRHTIGLSDYLEDSDIPAEERVVDGL